MNLSASVGPRAPAVLVTRDQRLLDAAMLLARRVGVRLVHTEDAAALAGSEAIAVLCGVDVGRDARGGIRERWTGVPAAVIGFGPADMDDAESPAIARYGLPDDAAGLEAFLERSAGPARTGIRVGILGAHGGVGATSLAIATSRAATRRGLRVALVDLDPAGGPLATHLGLDSGEPGWPDLLAAVGAVDDGGPCASSSAGREESDHPGGPEEQADGKGARARSWARSRRDADLFAVTGARGLGPDVPIHRFREAIEAIETGGDVAVSVIDASAGGPVPVERLAGWCDRIVVVARDDPAGEAAATDLIARVLPTGCPITLVRRMGPARRASRGWTGVPRGVSDVIALGDEAGMAEGARHGVLPGDRSRGALATCAVDLADSLGLTPPGAAPRDRRGGVRGGRRADARRAEPARRGNGIDAIGLVAPSAAGPPAFGPADTDDAALPEAGVFVGSSAASRRERRIARRTSRPRGERIGLWDEEWS
ncbi:MAG: hypothetical protein LBK72_06475 [Bifidobacteriaceae bacterium]|jgi:hypothetical protein|nr:hypothetical protein [Bifidobacteriaceae bacterium]